MNFGIGVILYNPDKFVYERLKEYRKVTNYLFIIDNTETKNEISNEIKKNFPLYHRSGKNEGMSVALNKIFDEALLKDIDWVLTMDQDSDFSNDSIEKMLNLIKNEQAEAAIYCPNYRKIYIDKDGNDYFGPYAIDKTKIKEVSFSMTSGSFCRMSDIKDVLPLVDLFIGYVDNDLCLELLQNKKKIKMIGSIGFSQRVGSEVTANFYNKFFRIVHHNELRYYYMTRNNLFLQRKYNKNKFFKRTLLKNLVRIHINILLGEKNKVKKIKYSYKGYLDYKNGENGKKK